MSAGARFDECLAAASTWLRVHVLTTTLRQYEQQSNKRNILAYCETHREEQHQQHQQPQQHNNLEDNENRNKNNQKHNKNTSKNKIGKKQRHGHIYSNYRSPSCCIRYTLHYCYFQSTPHTRYIDTPMALWHPAHAASSTVSPLPRHRKTTWCQCMSHTGTLSVFSELVCRHFYSPAFHEPQIGFIEA